VEAVAVGREVDDRLAPALLMLPFVLVALSLAAERSLGRLVPRSVAPPAVAVSPQASGTVAPEGSPAANALPAAGAASAPPPLPALALLVEPPPVSLLLLPPLAPVIEPPTVLPKLALVIEPSREALPHLSRLDLTPSERAPPPATIPDEASPPPLPALALLLEPEAPPLPRLALVQPAPEVHPAPEPICRPSLGRLAFGAHPPIASSVAPADPAAFGVALAAAAVRQVGDLVIYNASYRRIAYPMGDVAPLFGVCTDVVVRAYRALGIDLQALVHEARVGTGDRNIDHRRVEVVRRFLARQGQSLPHSDLADDYMPGDIVTYHRPQNRSSTAHIAIVTDILAPSGRPMIVHNRGWGPQLEDALFVDRITGHYRYTGPRTTTAEAAPRAVVAGR
jgi:uncharacterized protein YijF (DUF1287 family)